MRDDPNLSLKEKNIKIRRLKDAAHYRNNKIQTQKGDENAIENLDIDNISVSVPFVKTFLNHPLTQPLKCECP